MKLGELGVKLGELGVMLQLQYTTGLTLEHERAYLRSSMCGVTHGHIV